MVVAHAPEVKAAALADVALGQPIRAVARKHGVSPGTVLAWRNAAGLNSGEPFRTSSNRDELGELIAEYMRANINALTVQSDQFADPSWIQQQNAHDMGDLHAVLFTTLVTILERLRPAVPPAEAASLPPGAAR